jgi:hypothetical protein
MFYVVFEEITPSERGEKYQLGKVSGPLAPASPPEFASLCYDEGLRNVEQVELDAAVIGRASGHGENALPNRAYGGMCP